MKTNMYTSKEIKEVNAIINLKGIFYDEDWISLSNKMHQWKKNS